MMSSPRSSRRYQDYFIDAARYVESPISIANDTMLYVRLRWRDYAAAVIQPSPGRPIVNWMARCRLLPDMLRRRRHRAALSFT